MAGSFLVVDDDAFLREALSANFAAHGLRVETCASANEALHHLATRSCDYTAVLTDLQMPGMQIGRAHV